MNFEQIDLLMRTARNVPVNDAWLDDLCKQEWSSVSARIVYYRFLYLLVAAVKPKYCLELGVETGLASAHMARAAMRYGGHVIGVDLHWHAIPATQLPKVCNYTFILGNSADRSSDVHKIVGEELCLVFQDSSHHYEESIVEWKVYSPWMKTGSIWICDDVHPAFYDRNIDPPGMGMVQYFNSLPGQKKIYPYADGGNAIGVVLL